MLDLHQYKNSYHHQIVKVRSNERKKAPPVRGIFPKTHGDVAHSLIAKVIIGDRKIRVNSRWHEREYSIPKV